MSDQLIGYATVSIEQLSAESGTSVEDARESVRDLTALGYLTPLGNDMYKIDLSALAEPRKDRAKRSAGARDHGNVRQAKTPTRIGSPKVHAQWPGCIESALRTYCAQEVAVVDADGLALLICMMAHPWFDATTGHLDECGPPKVGETAQVAELKKQLVRVARAATDDLQELRRNVLEVLDGRRWSEDAAPAYVCAPLNNVETWIEAQLGWTR